jgi:hypothetical protein
MDENQSWNLESFLDSVIIDLDRAVDALSVKKDNVRMTYTVQDMSLTLQVFPQFDGDIVRFVTAQPGETGASTVEVQLGSIRDTQIHEIARRPVSRDDISLDMPEISRQEKRQLDKLGIKSANDLIRTVEGQNVDLERATDRKVNYQRLAEIIRKSRRQGLDAPRVDRVRLEPGGVRGLSVLAMNGTNLSPAPESPPGFPHATFGNQRVPVVAPDARRLYVALPADRPDLLEGQRVTIALDPYAVVTMRLQVPNPSSKKQVENHNA